MAESNQTNIETNNNEPEVIHVNQKDGERKITTY